MFGVLIKMLLIRNAENIERVRVSTGVTETRLLSINETASGRLAVSTYELEPWSEYGPIEYEGEMIYYVLSGRGNLAYAPGGPGEITNVMYDWDSDSYSYIAPRQRHSMSNQGQGPLSVLRVQYDAKRSPDSVIPWGVPIFKLYNPIRIDRMPSLVSIVNQTPQAFRGMGAEHFRAIEYEVVHKLPKRAVPAQATSDTQGEKPRDEIVNYVVRGRGSYLVEGREHPVKAGCLVYANPSQLIDLTPTKLVDLEQLTLDYLYFCIRI